jgi:polyphosphate kinase
VGNKRFAHLTSPGYKPRTLPPFENSENIFSVLDKQDVILYHPFESFDPITQLIQQAAKDPDVFAIRMTLYRAGANSPIVNALTAAAESGKQVTVMVELRARFDEENNLIWAKQLEQSGAHVIFGIRGFKVHAKAALVTKKVGDTLRQYAHIGTGNYNATTAKIYTDVSYLTSDKAITNDVTRFFHFLTGFSKKGKLNTLYMAPTQMKPKILSMIQNEAKMLEKGHIIVKVNSLVDDDVIRALYKASQAGVKIEIIVRGICCLRPGIEGISENIRVISIIGKYLEHARIFYFKHASPKIYLSSADWMPRNLIRRIELLTGIADEESASKLLQILQLQCSDNVLAYELKSDGGYVKVPTNKAKIINNQKLIETHTEKVYKAVRKENPNYIQQLAARLFSES